MTFCQTILFVGSIIGAVLCFARVIYLAAEQDISFRRPFRIGRRRRRAHPRRSLPRNKTLHAPPSPPRLVLFCIFNFAFLIDLTLAQTNALVSSNQPATFNFANGGSPQLSTNMVSASPNFRRVNGQLYNTEKSKLWENVTGTVISKAGGILIIETYVEQKQSLHLAARPTGGGNAGAYVGGPTPPVAVQKWREPGPTIAITNIPDYATLAEGNAIDTEVMRVGVLDSGGHTLELWDRGTLNRALVITTNWPAASGKLRNKPKP